MRVLLVISDLTLAGAQKQVVELARQMVRHGHEVAIYTLNRDVPRARELEGSGVELLVDQKRWKLDTAVLGRLRRRIVDWRADIVHGFLFDGDIYARIAAIGTGAVVVNSERSDAYTISITQRVAHWLTRALVDAVVANTHSGSRFAQRLYGYKPAMMHVVPNGIRMEALEREAESTTDYKTKFFGPGRHKVACLVGAIKPAKDYHLALDTAARLVRAHPEWRVLFLGDSLPTTGVYRPGENSNSEDYKQQVLRHHSRLGVPERIKFAGARADVPAIVAQCDVLFTTSQWEGFPNCVLEAMTLGVPVVSTEFSDIRRILPRPDQVVAERSARAIAQAIVDVHGDRAQVVVEQKRWVRSQASIEQVAQELENVYRLYLRPAALTQPT